MKRIILPLVAALFLTFTTSCMAENVYDTASPELKMSANGLFEYTEDGVVYRYYGGEVAQIPSEIDGTKIKTIGEKICFDLGISTLYIGEGIEEIRESAFEGCNITSADIPSSMKYIGNRAFANCTELGSIVLSSDTAEFGDDVFAGTSYLEFLTPCTSDFDSLREKIILAKGDDSFKFEEEHTSLVESMVEKDIYGNGMFYCEACGFKGSVYSENIELPFVDISSDSWYHEYVQTAYDLGIIVGKSDELFAPDDGMTCAEAAAIAARIREKQCHEHTTFEPIGEYWYDVYVTYCYRNSIIEDGVSFDWDKKATRGEMAYLFSRCNLMDMRINEVPLTDIPDVDEDTPYANEILALYNMGIAVGSNEYMAYYPNAEVTRSEAAALVSRILFINQRIELPKG